MPEDDTDGDVLTAGIADSLPKVHKWQTRNTLPPGYVRWQPLEHGSSWWRKGIVVLAPRDRFGTVMTERVQHNGVVGLTRECESASHRGDPERGSVESLGIFLYLHLQ